ncbi:unnamed protein product [Allacma fusca]|uniref:Ankyrin repeat domain-containing protein 49 n=1 Tax=Allacma fusca TaxID=39272 RepID=A0A8J2LIS9_9HEXA|nr:unnamed protein product [Allacma fusca]
MDCGQETDYVQPPVANVPNSESTWDEDEDGDLLVEDDNKQGGLHFLKLAQKGLVGEMTNLLSSDSSLLSFQDSDGYSALHRAAYSEQVNVVEFLLNQGADIMTRTIDGWTALHSACRWNSFQCATLLIQKGADVNGKTDGGLTPLHVASENAIARETLIVLLLNESLDEALTNLSGETAETVASQHGSYSYLFELIRKSLICKPTIQPRQRELMFPEFAVLILILKNR